jgi:NadR type nicotinamide-nucleotide adenylyltransferase
MVQIIQKNRESLVIQKAKKGLIIGKFLPPHSGHKYLVDFARNYVGDLKVMVCSLKTEEISGKLRYQWMQESFPDVDVFHLDKKMPQEPKDHPKFWKIWKENIKRLVPEKIDYLFASEDYGWELAKVLGAQYIPVNHARDIVPIGGGSICNNPMKYWDYVLPAARKYFLKRVCVFGPESTGKSTLAKKLAKHFKTVAANEYARDLLNFYNGACDYEHIDLIAKGHYASEEALAKQANRVLFSDTDSVTTVIWSNVLFKKCPEWIKKMSYKRKYDLYLLLDIDTPWIKDVQRYFPEEAQRKDFLNLCKKELEKRGCKYVLINGSWAERFKKAVKEVEKVLGN